MVSVRRRQSEPRVCRSRPCEEPKSGRHGTRPDNRSNPLQHVLLPSTWRPLSAPSRSYLPLRESCQYLHNRRMEPPRADLTAYVPRIVVEWALSEPESLHRRLDGTMAFVDVSGFTTMSERLSAKGKAGAEEVTDVMNTTLPRLLDVAYARGGGLLKFGGDALPPVSSRGTGHAARATRAAFDMREHAARDRTAGTRLRARSRCACTSAFTAARFDFFLVGRGRTVSCSSRAPRQPRPSRWKPSREAGEILVSPATAGAAGSHESSGRSEGEGRLLRARAGRRRRIGTAPPTRRGSTSRRSSPSACAGTSRTAAAEGEHRAAAVAFVRFGGVDELLADGRARRGGGGALAGALVESVQAAAEEYDVWLLESDIDRDGGRDRPRRRRAPSGSGER